MPRIFLTSSNTYATGSGYLNLSVRAKIAELDNATGSYLSIKRTTGFKLIKPSDPFNDTRTINYLTGTNVKYPLVLDQADATKYERNWIATPNEPPQGLDNVTGIVKPGVSDQDLLFSIHQAGGFTPFDESRIYLERTQFYMTGTRIDVLPGFNSPLKDKIQIKIDIGAKSPAMMSRYMYRGLTNDMGRADVSVPAFYQQNYTGFRYFNFENSEWERIGLRDPGTGAAYNPTMWHQVTSEPKFWKPGKLGPKFKTYQFAMSSQLGYMAKDYDDLYDWGYRGIGSPTSSGAAPYSGSYHATGSQLLSMSDYINHPFLLEKAVLEIPILYKRKAGNRGIVSGGGKSSAAKVDLANRDIDNFVFFIYRQENPEVANASLIDSPSFCSGSKRFIVMSGSMSFYNSRVFNSTIRTSISGGLPHSPAFSYDFDIPVSQSKGAMTTNYPTSQFQNTIRVEMTPGVPSAYRSGGSRFPVRESSTAASSTTPTILIQDFWAGGTTFPKPSTVGMTTFPAQGEQNSSYNVSDIRVTEQLAWGNCFHGAYNSQTVTASSRDFISEFDFYDFRPSRSPTGLGNLSPSYMTPFYPANAEVATSLGTSVSKNVPTSIRSPYLLFPEDKLVFGMDAGISMIPAGIGTDSNNYFSSDIAASPMHSQGQARNDEIGCAMSSSFMKIKVGAASLTLYGSLIKENQEKLFQLNQNLTSDAIHEDMHYSNTVLDQFQIEPRYSYSGSYIDNCVAGNIGRETGLPDLFGGFQPQTVTRGVIRSIGSPAVGATSIRDFYGTRERTISHDPFGLADWNTKMWAHAKDGFLRGTQCFSEERSYDTIMPDIVDFALRSGMSLMTPIKDKNSTGILATLNGTLNETGRIGNLAAGEPDEANKKAYPYDTAKERELYRDVSLFVTARGLQGGGADFEGAVVYPFLNCLKTTMRRRRANPNLVKCLLFKNGITVSFEGHTLSAKPISGTIMYAPPYSTGSATRPNSHSHGAQGFLYGIENVAPVNSKAVFRYDRYGQFRDMLEQRKDRRYFDQVSKKVLDAVVECMFVSSSDGMTIRNPYNTQSSNMSQWATSSKPYFDGVNTNTTSKSSRRFTSFLLRPGRIAVADVGKG